MGRRRCAYCGGELAATARATARYCAPPHRWAANRLRAELRLVEKLLRGEHAGRFSYPAEYAASRRSIARAAQIGAGRARYVPGNGPTLATDARQAHRTAIRSNGQERAA